MTPVFLHSLKWAAVQWARGILVLAALIALAGCAQTQLTQAEFPDDAEVSRIVLMPTDIELYELTAGGLLEPQAAWTKAARTHVDEALGQIVSEAGEEMIAYNGGGGIAAEHLQIVKLHAAVGNAIKLHKYGPGFQLPTKETTFDWSLGPEAARLNGSHDAHYALFIHVRDSYASAGRAAVIVLGALLGVGVPGGQQVGFASLVDLHSGDVVWFSQHFSGTGDLRQFAPAKDAVAALMKDFPL